MTLPADLVNGLTFTVLKNVPTDGQQTQASIIVATPKPRIVKLQIAADGEGSFLVGDIKHKATHYRVKLRVGGI